MEIQIIDDLIKLNIKQSIISNAINMGWSVYRIDDNKFVIKKKINQMSETEKCTKKLLNMLFDVYY